jgi:peptide/nickel transport system permease protein
VLSDERSQISTSLVAGTVPWAADLLHGLGLNLLGDGLRDILDPRLRRSGAGLK